MPRDDEHPARPDVLPPQDGAKNSGQGIALYAQRTQISYSSFLPPAQELERLQRLLPDATERLFAEVEREARARREDTRFESRHQALRSDWGLALAFVSFSLCIRVVAQ